MKKKFACIFAAAILLFSFSGCNNKTEAPESPNVSEMIGNSTDELDDDLTDPSEYMSEYCSSARINGIEFSAPCTYEELSKLFVLEPFGQKVEFEVDGFYVQPYKMLTKDGEYIGIVDFTYFDDGGNVLWSLESAYNKNAAMSVVIGGIEPGKTLRSEIEARLGEGDDPLGDGDYAAYYFVDGSLSVLYREDTVVFFNAWFDPLKTA